MQVQYEDHVKLESVKTQSQFLHCSQYPLSSVKMSLQKNQSVHYGMYKNELMEVNEGLTVTTLNKQL